jgi:hypothetical protein
VPAGGTYVKLIYGDMERRAGASPVCQDE